MSKQLKKILLTDFERFVYDNSNRSVSQLASELNRTESSVQAAYNRADWKIKEREAREARPDIVAEILAKQPTAKMVAINS